VANLPTGVLMLDLELRVLAASDHWEFSAPEHPAALRGRLLHEVLPPGTPWEAAAAQALTGEASRVDEDASVFRGARRFLHWDARPWRTVDGAIGGVLLSAEDVTDRVVQRQQAERERDTRLATLSLFAGGVAHEINNPLQVILLEAELIGREATAEAPSLDAIAESAQSVADTARRAGAITRALRTLSRDARSDPAEAVPVTRLLRDAEALCRARFASGGVALTLDDRSAGAKVLGRPAELLHVLLNLLHNAHDAAKGTDGAWTRLSAEREGDTVVFRCVDSGPGVSREDIPRLMDPFFTTKEVGHGTGLGLAIAQALATRDGGTLTYEADAAHTTFVVRVPAASEVAP
jgi:C4-dicarboxylate-specific signal transduction histidine kinase